MEIGVSGFFTALRSSRRGAMVAESSRGLYRLAASRMAEVDMLEAYPELEGIEIYPMDERRIGEAAHVNTLYRLEIRNGLVVPVAVAGSAQGEIHEMKAFCDRKSVTGGHALGIVDKAYVDNRWWDQQSKKGSLMLMPAKSNMAPVFHRDLAWDHKLPVKQGVLSDSEAGFNCGHALRWICFRDSESGEHNTFITTCWTLPPRLLCMLYLMR